MSLESFLQHQQQGVYARHIARTEGISPLIATRTKDNALMAMFLASYRLSEVRIGRRNPNNIFALVAPDGFHECWAATGYGGYRKGFFAFVRQLHGEDIGPAAGHAGFDVDHVLNKAQADGRLKDAGPDDPDEGAGGSPQGPYVRLFLVNASANRSFGSLEKLYTAEAANVLTGGQLGGVANWGVLAKLLGVMGPAKEVTDSYILGVARSFAERGWLSDIDLDSAYAGFTWPFHRKGVARVRDDPRGLPDSAPLREWLR